MLCFSTEDVGMMKGQTSHQLFRVTQVLPMSKVDMTDFLGQETCCQRGVRVKVSKRSAWPWHSKSGWM